MATVDERLSSIERTYERLVVILETVADRDEAATRRAEALDRRVDDAAERAEAFERRMEESARRAEAFDRRLAAIDQTIAGLAERVDVLGRYVDVNLDVLQRHVADPDAHGRS